MRRSLLLIALAFSVQAGVLDDPYQEYRRSFEGLRKDIEVIGSVLKGRYPELFFREEGDTPVEIAAAIRGDDWRRFKYEKLDSLTEALGTAIATSIPDINPYLKTVRVDRREFASESFRAKVSRYKEYVRLLVQLADVVRQEARGAGDDSFLAGFEELDSPERLSNWKKWSDASLAIREEQLDNAIEDFRAKYGPTADRINLAEIILMNVLPCFKGGLLGPSHWEPIVRATPISYDLTDKKLVKVYQLGFNYYFLSDAPGLLRWLNHVGVAAGAADLAAEQIYNFEFGSLSFGGMLHVNRYQAGVFKDRSGDGWKVLSTVDFQVIPALF